MPKREHFGAFGGYLKIAIQGELGSNSHMAALALLAGEVEIVSCTVSAEAFEQVAAGAVDGAVLPIENSLHGSVAEHYDLLLQHPVRIVAESLLRVCHNLIAGPGVSVREVRRVLSHPVALAQCRRFLASHRELQVVPFYDTAGSVKHIVEAGLRDAAAIAPLLAAAQYGGSVLLEGLEDHEANFTRFHLLVREDAAREPERADKMSLAFAIEHRPGSLAAVLERVRGCGGDLTKIESRPVPGSPWEYVFHVDVRYVGEAMAAAVAAALQGHCRVVKELGRYRAA